MFLVTGATGRVGRLVAQSLAADGHRVRGLTRDPAAELPHGVERAIGDLRNASTLPRDASAVVLIWALGSADGAPAAVEALTAGGARVVYISSAAVEDGAARQDHPYSAFHSEIERLLATNTREWTTLRATTFAANALAWAKPVQERATIELPLASTRRSPVHEADVAACAVAAVTAETPVNGVRIVSGPQSLNEAQIVDLLGDTLGVETRWREVGVEHARRDLLADGVDEELAAAAARYWQRLAETPEPVTDTVARLTGNTPRTFADWVADNARAFCNPSY